jgi:hypothetical protein
MNKLYKFEKVNEVKNDLGKLRVKEFTLQKTGNKKINIQTVKSYVDNLEKEAQQKGLNIEILVRGVGVLGNNLCLKGLKQNTDNMIETYEEYYEGSVRDASKFEDLFSSRITIFYK